jgi:outer membrane protein assembly factor BamD (BamD/ComL family)
MLMCRECANKYPESLYAGRSLDKISNYYITIAKDYRRAMELFEQVFQDYPDASFLDQILYKWVVAAHKNGDFELSAQKCDQLLAEYPGSESAAKAIAFRAKMKSKKDE